MEKKQEQLINAQIRYYTLGAKLFEQQLSENTQEVPTLERAVEARIKNIVLERGIGEIFDKLLKDGGRASLDNLIYRQTAKVAEATIKAIEKTYGDSVYKSEIAEHLRLVAQEEARLKRVEAEEKAKEARK